MSGMHDEQLEKAQDQVIARARELARSLEPQG
jgi:hypothetical protein